VDFWRAGADFLTDCQRNPRQHPNPGGWGHYLWPDVETRFRISRFAALVGFGCHPVVLGPNNLLISADFPGAAMNAVEAGYGGDFVSAFVYGGGGDINPTVHGGTFDHVNAMGEALAREAAAALDAIDILADASVKVRRRSSAESAPPVSPLRLPVAGMRLPPASPGTA